MEIEFNMFDANDVLRDYFSEFTNEIAELHRTSACGCSLCVVLQMQQRHPEIKIPVGGLIG